MSNRLCYIYSLNDPITNEIRYIGKTVKKLKYRLSSHIYDSKRIRNHRTNWIKSIVNKGLLPIIQLIEETTELESSNKEKYWINYYKNLNYNLINQTDGGEGAIGAIRSENTKIKMRNSIGRVLGKSVYQFDLEGNFIQYYKTMADAARCTNSTVTKISACCRGIRKKHNNYKWSFVDKYINNKNKN